MDKYERDKLLKLINSLPVFVSYINSDLRYVLTNEANKKFLGKDPVGITMPEIFGPERFELVRPHVEKVLKGETVDWEITMPRGHNLHYVEGTYTPDLDPSGKVVGFFVHIRDVTEKKLHRMRVEEERETLLNALREAVRARDEFLSMASHELKTPITSLILNADLKKLVLRSGERAEPEKELEALNIQTRQLHRINQIIDDMLDLSRIRIGKLEMNKKVTDFARVVEESLTKLGPLLLQTLGEVNYDTVEDATVHADPFRLEQVVTNLLSNAIKYGEKKPISVVLKKSEAHVTLIVEDQGRGISIEDQRRIFKRFERAVAGSDISGLGLGLTIVKEIVESHQGHIFVDSAPGKGSRFVVELPLMLAN